MPADFSAGGRLEVRITPADVGKRVSVRQLTEVADGRPTFTDTVGVLASWDEGVVHDHAQDRGNRPDRGIRAGRGQGRARPRRRAARAAVPAVTDEELDAVAARAWPPAETAPLGDWTLRDAGGFTRRANSVLVARRPRACRWTRRCAEVVRVVRRARA